MGRTYPCARLKIWHHAALGSKCMEQDVRDTRTTKGCLYLRKGSRFAVRLVKGMVSGSLLLNGRVGCGDQAGDDFFSIAATML